MILLMCEVQIASDGNFFNKLASAELVKKMPIAKEMIYYTVNHGKFAKEICNHSVMFT